MIRLVGRMDGKQPKLTKAHEDAGIVQILPAQNYNGSWVCLVDLRKVDLKNTKANPRRHSRQHGYKISQAWLDLCVRNPILRYEPGRLSSIDGRHTSYNILNRATDSGPVITTCDVHFNITDTEAARIFHDLVINSKRIDQWDAVLCAIQCEMKYALEIRDMLTKYGLTTPNTLGRNKATADVGSYTPLYEAWVASNGLLEKLCFLLDQIYRGAGNRVTPQPRSVSSCGV